ncbi:MAG: signal peptidase I [bacterium]
MSIRLSPRQRRWIRDWGLALLVPIVLVTSFRSAIADWNDVPTGSMIPTILEGERIFVNKLAYDLKLPYTQTKLARWSDPDRGDIVICHSPKDGTRLVKRVIGIPGDVLTLRDNVLFLNGEPQVYGPPDPRAAALAAVEAPDRHLVYSEDLSGHRHAIMTTPRIAARRDFGPVTVPADQYFVMGDNRDNSSDSRYFGCISREVITGEVLGVVASVDLDNHWRPRWGRFFRHLE